MAQLSLGEPKWRMIRRALKKRQFRFEDCRNMTRNDQRHFDWLVENGFFQALGAGLHTLTDKGKASADLGLYEWEPTRPAAPAPRPAKPAARGSRNRG
jgi:hypothetical protein